MQDIKGADSAAGKESVEGVDSMESALQAPNAQAPRKVTSTPKGTA